MLTAPRTHNDSQNTTNTMSLHVENLTKEYPISSGSLTILKDLNLDLQPGEAVAVMGPSGSGKSTLLYVLGTLEQPTSGKVLLENQDPFALSERELAEFRNRNVGFIFQDHHLLPQCTVLENVLIPTLVTTNPAENLEKWARELIEKVGLSDRIDHRPAELSGGERQRVAVARALINRPKLLLADEPTGNLDRDTAQTIGGLLLDLHKQEQTILIVVTHSSELAQTFPKRMEMVEGRLEEREGPA